MRKKLRLFRETVRVLTPAESKQAFAAGRPVEIEKKTDNDPEPNTIAGMDSCNLLECGGNGGIQNTDLWPCYSEICVETEYYTCGNEC